ncbi:MAG TPA: zinc ribbon domain-containing protein [Vicinamibacterales bacterium]|nr:zinc ribbon domain-containing protein [Vicinamibacterales bacterium]
MPLYEYQCDACGARFEVIRKFSDPPLEICTTCGKGPITKLVSSPAFQFKGSGWYVTDYAKKSGASSPAGESSSTATKEKEKDSGKDTGGDKGDKTDKPAASSTPAPASTTPTKDS